MILRTREPQDLRLVTGGNQWDAFVKQQPNTLFVQSSHYGDFYRAMGEQAWIIGSFRGDELVGGSLAVSVHAKRGNFLYLPYGPIGEYGKDFFSFASALAKQEQMDFVRASPFLEVTPASHEYFTSFGFRQAPMHMLAETTWMLNLAASEEDLLGAMNKNHRNLIRRCAKEGVRVTTQTDEHALARFNDLHDTTASRHKFHRFSRNYIEQEFHAFAPHGETVIIEGYLPDGTLDASAIIMLYGTMACYRHGASLGANKRLPTSYLVQWEAIRQAKQRGMRWYNFWGIAPPTASPSHPFYGITHFKKGFGGVQKDLVPCQDMPLTPRYWLTWTIESIRRAYRGF